MIMSTRILFPALAFFLFVSNAFAQITLEQCHEKARANYPLVNQYGLIEKSKEYNLSNAAKAWLPQVSMNAKATWQSEVTELPFTMPDIGEMDKDQYQATIEISQTLWDGGATRARKEMYEASAEIEKQKYEVDLYSIRERVNQLYLGILLLNEQIEVIGVLKKDLETSFSRIESMMKNGIASQADLDAIRVEQLKADQSLAEILSARNAYFQMLSAFTGETFSENTPLIKPVLPEIKTDTFKMMRPELFLFDAQSRITESQEKLIRSASKPKLGLFAQGGYGKPGLNMLSNEFSPFFIGGVRLSWSLGSFYTQGNDLQLLKINSSSAEIQKQTFIFNTNLKIAQQNTEIEKWQKLLESDDEIIQLRKSIKSTTDVRLENGTATASDLIRDTNALTRAMFDKAMHETQLLITYYNLKNSTNQ